MQRPETADIFPQQQMFLPVNTQHEPTTTDQHTSNWSTNFEGMESMPWKIRKADESGDVIEFTALKRPPCPFNSDYRRVALLHQKRKSEEPPLIPSKQFISEEKFTAHFNGLHISSDYIQHNTSNPDDEPSTSGKCFSNLTYEDYQMTAKQLEEKLRNANRITICDELIEKIHEEQKKVSYLPEALLLNRIDKPCTALVLWQPPPPFINMFKPNNINETGANSSSISPDDTIDDYIPDVDLPPETEDEDAIDDYIDNNNTCNLDFNNMKADSMDEDM